MKILLADVETKPNLVASWGLFKQNIAINQIFEPGATISWAAKWVGDKDVSFMSEYHDGEAEMIQGIHDLLDEADAVITYNGKKFDIPTLNKEFVLYGLPPPSPYKNIDLYATVRSQFRFTSNKLDFICQQLGLGAKVKHKGMDLWRECMDGNEKSWNQMRRYNIQDVKLLEKLYKHMLPWIKGHPNVALYDSAGKPTCPSCGSTKLQYRGYSYTQVGKFHRVCCNSCGTWSRERVSALDKEEKRNILTRDNMS